MKTKVHLSRKIVFILFGIFVSVILTPCEYVCGRSLFPDENLDFSWATYYWSILKENGVFIALKKNMIERAEKLIKKH